MPIFHFICNACSKNVRRILEPAQVEGQKHACGGALVRVPQGPSTLVTESLDNGLMVRKVERIADAERIFRERSQNSEEIKEKY